MNKILVSAFLATAALGFVSCAVPSSTADTTAPASSPLSQPPAERESGQPPVLRELPGGMLEVKFQNGCVVLFDGTGKLLSGGRVCDDVDLFKARQAAKAYLAEKNADFSGV